MMTILRQGQGNEINRQRKKERKKERERGGKEKERD